MPLHRSWSFGPRSWLGKDVRAVAAIATIAGGLACSPCASNEVKVDGTCVPRCSDETCADGLVCVRSTCRPACERDSDCKDQDICERVRSDDGTLGNFCYGLAVSPSPYEDPTTPEASSRGEETSPPPNADDCVRSSDCDQDVPRVCVDQRCETECAQHQHCGRAGACTGNGTSSEGVTVAYCQADEFPRAEGQYGSKCLTGNDACDAEAGFECIGAGDGDVGSYCTQAGCDLDGDCPSGYFCSTNRVSTRLPCEDACQVPGAPDAPDCIPREAIGPSKAYRCAEEGGLLLALCLERSFCTPCETDADCRAEANQVCAKGPDGTKSCTVLCAPNQGSCPWGNATECAVFDEQLGRPTCGHRFGSCKGTGKSCEPCIDDADCPTGFCTKSSFSGELFCYDADATCSCAQGEEICVGGGCPTTPSGAAMNCVSAGDGEPPSACYGAEIDEVGGTPLGCW